MHEHKLFPKRKTYLKIRERRAEGGRVEKEGEREHEMGESASAPGKKQLDAALFMANS